MNHVIWKSYVKSCLKYFIPPPTRASHKVVGSRERLYIIHPRVWVLQRGCCSVIVRRNWQSLPPSKHSITAPIPLSTYLFFYSETSSFLQKRILLKGNCQYAPCSAYLFSGLTTLWFFLLKLTLVGTSIYLCVWVICVPGWPQRLLTTNIPHEKMSVLHNYFFNIASYGWRGMNHFIHQAVERQTS